MPPRGEAIVDPDDPRIAAFRGVGDPALARELGCFVAEGRLVVSRVLADPRYRVRALLLSPGAFDHLRHLLDPHGSPRVFVAGDAVFQRVTGYNIHRGCLALVERPAPRDWVSLASGAPAGAAVVVLEAVGNPDNIGGVFRNAAAFGASAVLLDPACADPLYRKAVRTSMGTVLGVPFATMAPWPAAIGELRAAGWTVAALTGRGDADLATCVACQAASARVAWLLGHEGGGLSEPALAGADVRVRIPIADRVDSLNVAAAAAIALYAWRARHSS